MNVYKESVIPFTQFGGTTMSGEFPNFNGEENWLTIFAGEGGFSNQTSMPDGNYPPVTWKMALKAGAITSRNKQLGSGVLSSNAVLGYPASIGMTGVGNLSNAEGSLLAYLVSGLVGSGTLSSEVVGGLFIICDLFGEGSITPDLTDGITREDIEISISAEGTLTAVITGGKYAEITLSGAADLEGALGALAGAVCEIISTGNIANSTLAGKGHISAAITPFTELSPQSLASSLWNSIASSYNAAGTMGEKLNDAGSASNPWTEIIEGSYTATDMLRIISAILAGKTTINSTGDSHAEITFRDISDTENLITASMTGSERTNLDINT